MASKTIEITKSVTNKIVGAFVGAFSKANNQSNIVTQLCDTVAEDYGTQPIPAPHIKLLTESLAKESGWKGRTGDSRKSEARAVMRSHHVLKGLCAAVLKDRRCESFTWHSAIKVARIWVRLNKKSVPKVAAVISEFFKKSPTSTADPLDTIGAKLANLAPRKGTKKATLVADLLQVFAKAGYTFE